ncbi:unnamed protein product [Cladocopium goreaui]|uniref:Uncharacterized protein n=1 Tax=Cladocopium goreaui TaxID=2562237 RepID=A0A9P1M688_9DINO|nr:unnamed protein product [Cladocopium goreaui]
MAPRRGCDSFFCGWRLVGLLAVLATRRLQFIAAFASGPALDKKAVPLQHLVTSAPLLRGTKVGGDDAPVVFLLDKHAQHLTRYILEDPDGPFHAKTLEWPQRLYDDVHGKNEPDDEDWVDAENWKRWDFQFSKREPFMLKADWHSVPGWGDSFEIFVPRKNKVMPVRQAPLRLVAFLEAFRRVNEECWQEILAELRVMQAQKPDDYPRSRLLRILIEDFEERGFFGAIEAQAGPGRRKEMHWHRDGATGLLHLGITLSGKRRLQLRAWMEEEWTQELSMSAGHIYLSSPFLFEHCISYRPEEPTLALMCRFGFMDEEDSLWVNHLRGRDMLEANLLGIAAEGRMERFVFFLVSKITLKSFFSHRIGIPSFLWWRH